MPRKKKKIYKNIVLKNVKTYEDLPPSVAIRIERGAGGRRTFRYVNEAICTAIEKGEGKPWGYITIAKPSEFEGERDGAYIAKILESDNEWGPLLLRIAIEWASKNNDGLIADRFERLGIDEDKIATSFIFFSNTNMLQQLLKGKRIC